MKESIVVDAEMKSLTKPEVAATVLGWTFIINSIGTNKDPDPNPFIGFI